MGYRMPLEDHTRSISVANCRAASWHSSVRETSDSVARSAVVQRSRTAYIELKLGTPGTLALEAQPGASFG